MLGAKHQLAKNTGNLAGFLSRTLQFGHGTSMPGHVALFIDPDYLSKARSLIREGCIFVTGTNGKSTTTARLVALLCYFGKRVLVNSGGSNMASGIVSACLKLDRPVDYAVFEVDEAYVEKLSRDLLPSHILLLNLSRDQLDRYAEIDELVHSIIRVGASTRLIYNYNNLHAAQIGLACKNSLGYMVEYREQVSLLDQPVCHRCHSGILNHVTHNDERILSCSSCGNFTLKAERATFNGERYTYQKIQLSCDDIEQAECLMATSCILEDLGFSQENIAEAQVDTHFTFVHQMKAQKAYCSSKVNLVLAKNPASFNRHLDQIVARPKLGRIVFAINHNTADGQDTSWLWDVEFEKLAKLTIPLTVLGTATADIRLRLRVATGLTAETINYATIPSWLTVVPEPVLILANYTAYRVLEPLVKTTYVAESVGVKFELVEVPND